MFKLQQYILNARTSNNIAPLDLFSQCLLQSLLQADNSIVDIRKVMFVYVELKNNCYSSTK